jgi:superfamily II DNA/RNA helicase
MESTPKDPCYVTVGSINATANHNILQIADVCADHEKQWKLSQLMREIMQEEENKTLIFTETKRRADELMWQMKVSSVIRGTLNG